MTRTWVYDKNGRPHEVVRQISQHHFVQSDISEHGGRRAWRERLKQNGSIEMSPREMQEASQKFISKRAEAQAKIATAPHTTVRPVDVDILARPDYELSRLNKEVKNRLDGRPAPDRKMLIKLTLEQARDLRNR